MADLEAYQTAMREAANAAWEENWGRAAAAYGRALQLNPNDSQALAGLALSLSESGQLKDALQTYERVSQIIPDDPLSHEKMADIYKELNQPEEAAKKYHAVAQIYFERKDLAKATHYWEKAIRLNPDFAQGHIKLAAIYGRNKATYARAIYSYIALARLLAQYNQRTQAERALQRARDLDPLNTEVQKAIDFLRQGKPIPRIAPSAFGIDDQLALEPIRVIEDEGEDLDDDLLEEAVEGRSPADEAAHHAMSLLADLIWSGQMSSGAQRSLIKAIDLHQVGDAAGAITHYEEALRSGLDHAALRFNLGLLYQYERKHAEAVDLLTQAVDTPEYSLAAHLALGQIYLNEGQHQQSARQLIEALREADRQVSIGGDIDEAGYDRLRASISAQPAEQLAELSKGIALYLDDINWLSKLRETRARYLTQNKTSYVSDLIELVREGGRPEMAEVMQRIDSYIDKGALRLAMDETQYAIEKSPDYLPAHRRMADILVKEGRALLAADKINLVANTYLIRGNAERAADLFAEVLAIWPTDMPARQRVIDMLKDQGRVSEALRHYSEMADQYYRVRFDHTKATETYKEALAYAERNNARAPQLVAILKSLAHIEAQQLNWKGALRYYHRCRELAPDDETVALAVVDMTFKIGDSTRAVAELDQYIRYCITNGYGDRVLPMLEKVVRQHQTEVAIRQRLAEVYRQQNRIQEAIAQYDAIGEMLMESERIDEAMVFIKKIVDLNPPDVEDYKTLLEQLGGMV